MCLFGCVHGEREGEKTFIHSDVRFLRAYFTRFIDLAHTQQLLLFRGYHVRFKNKDLGVLLSDIPGEVKTEST